MEYECLLCLEIDKDINNYLNIHSDQEKENNIVDLIEKHLWSVDSLKTQSPWLCAKCWRAVHEFHQFYKHIEDVQTYFEHVVKTEEISDCEIITLSNNDQDEICTQDDAEMIVEISECDSEFDVQETQNDIQKVPTTKPHIHRADNSINKESDKTIDNATTATLQCSSCFRKLKSQEALSKHMAWHKGNIFSCELCDLIYVDRSKLIEHKRVHAPKPKIQEPFNPDVAEETQLSFVSFSCDGQEYMEAEFEHDILNANDYACSYCSKVLGNERSLSKHIAWHEEKIYQCRICDLKFFDKNAYATHKSLHGSAKSSNCSNADPSESQTPSTEVKDEEDDESYSNSAPSPIEELNAKQSEKRFKCKYCSTVYVYEQAYMNHVAMHEKNLYCCNICGAKFLSAYKFKRHKLAHNSNQCLTDETQNDIDQEQKFQLQEDNGQLNKELCYNEKPSLEASEDTNNSDANVRTIFTCNLCCKNLDSEHILEKHIAWHDGNIFQCKECELKFFDSSVYENHRMSHEMSQEKVDEDDEDTNEQEYFMCTICSRVFRSRRLYLNHNAWHTNTIYQCEICDMKFLDRLKLESHTETHMPRTWKRCRDCRKAFSCATEVINHYKKMHRNEYINVCDVCGKRYRCPLSFKLHVDRHKGNTLPKLPCKICGRLLANKHCLKSHMLINHPEGGVFPYVCDICLKPMPTRAILRRHITLYHDKQGIDHKCMVCGRTFANLHGFQKHSLTHSAEPKFSCPWCTEKFFVSTMLSRHRKKVHPQQYAEWKRQQYVQTE